MNLLFNTRQTHLKIADKYQDDNTQAGIQIGAPIPT